MWHWIIVYHVLLPPISMLIRVEGSLNVQLTYVVGKQPFKPCCEENGCHDDETKVTEAGPKFITSKNSRLSEWNLVTETRKSTNENFYSINVLDTFQLRCSLVRSWPARPTDLEDVWQSKLKNIFALSSFWIFTRISLYQTKGASYEISTCTTEADIEIWQLLLSLVWCAINRCSGFIDDATMFRSNTLQYTKKKSKLTMQ